MNAIQKRLGNVELNDIALSAPVDVAVAVVLVHLLRELPTFGVIDFLLAQAPDGHTPATIGVVVGIPIFLVAFTVVWYARTRLAGQAGPTDATWNALLSAGVLFLVIFVAVAFMVGLGIEPEFPFEGIVEDAVVWAVWAALYWPLRRAAFVLTDDSDAVDEWEKQHLQDRQ